MPTMAYAVRYSRRTKPTLHSSSSLDSSPKIFHLISPSQAHSRQAIRLPFSLHKITPNPNKLHLSVYLSIYEKEALHNVSFVQNILLEVLR
jgi:hypothetical protein